jgi:16S rRNA (uracil1498-N3)-methyltransferase
MQRFFLPPELFKGEQIMLSDEVAHQVRDVLRMRVGEEVILLDNNGWEYSAQVLEIGKKRVSVVIGGKRAAPPEPRTQITLYQAMPKKDKFEWILQKCTELGVARFVPVLTERTISDQVTAAKQQRWERILTEAAEQSGRGRLPLLDDPLDFEAALETAKACDVRLIPYEQEKGVGLRDALGSNVQTVALFIGPEGGFAEWEIAAAAEAGVQPISLGRNILRTETAAVVASALVLFQSGEI